MGSRTSPDILEKRRIFFVTPKFEPESVESVAQSVCGLPSVTDRTGTIHAVTLQKQGTNSSPTTTDRV